LFGIELALHIQYKIVVTEINLVLQALPRRRLSFALPYKFTIALLCDMLGFGKSTQNPIGRQTNLRGLFQSTGGSDCPSNSKRGNTNHSDPPRFSTATKTAVYHRHSHKYSRVHCRGLRRGTKHLHTLCAMVTPIQSPVGLVTVESRMAKEKCKACPRASGDVLTVGG
jgi:hypothetical protein